ncbi:MICOS complex subunit MIC27 isoform X2 [Denticeps clupeoides]|uniref:MICOS complex subunit MIC27 isoform X2 n=1 Tax=Denticeps clupeoides TaxID=299321 RepID=UPI0010A360AD|nr:uncharacterized protein LOC114793164 isoform X2 [Denticeps clupeoides]
MALKAVKLVAVPGAMGLAAFRVYALSEEQEEDRISPRQVSQPSGHTRLRLDAPACELSVYPAEPPPMRYVEEQPGVLQRQLGTFRVGLQPYVRAAQSTYSSVKVGALGVYNAAQDAYSFMKDPPADFLPSVGIITVSGLAGLILARKGSRLKRMGVSLSLATVGTAVCYPTQTVGLLKMTGKKICAASSFVASVFKPKPKDLISIDASMELVAPVLGSVAGTALPAVEVASACNSLLAPPEPITIPLESDEMKSSPSPPTETLELTTDIPAQTVVFEPEPAPVPVMSTELCSEPALQETPPSLQSISATEKAADPGLDEVDETLPEPALGPTPFEDPAVETKKEEAIKPANGTTPTDDSVAEAPPAPESIPEETVFDAAPITDAPETISESAPVEPSAEAVLEISTETVSEAAACGPSAETAPSSDPPSVDKEPVELPAEPVLLSEPETEAVDSDINSPNDETSPVVEAMPLPSGPDSPFSEESVDPPTELSPSPLSEEATPIPSQSPLPAEVVTHFSSESTACSGEVATLPLSAPSYPAKEATPILNEPTLPVQDEDAALITEPIMSAMEETTPLSTESTTSSGEVATPILTEPHCSTEMATPLLAEPASPSEPVITVITEGEKSSSLEELTTLPSEPVQNEAPPLLTEEVSYAEKTTSPLPGEVVPNDATLPETAADIAAPSEDQSNLPVVEPTREKAQFIPDPSLLDHGQANPEDADMYSTRG